MNRARRILKSTRLWGLLGTAFVLWFLCFKVFANYDVSWFMPNTRQLAQAVIDVWPTMPIFEVKKEPVNGGKERYISYTVPTRQFTQAELAKMGMTNAVTQPAKPSAK